jgi:hypothetical protein
MHLRVTIIVEETSVVVYTAKAIVLGSGSYHTTQEFMA